jgi:CHAT domain-containing protein
MWLHFYRKSALWSTLVVLLSACTTQIRSGDAICDGTRQARADLARALLDDGGDQSVMAGQVLLSQLLEACR